MFVLTTIVVMMTCGRTPTVHQTKPSSTLPVAATKQGAEIRMVIFENPRLKLPMVEWWPIEVTNVAEENKKEERNGTWILEIRNVSDQPIKSVVMNFSPPPDCDGFTMSAGLLVGLGQERYLTKPAKPTLGPLEADRIIIDSKELDEIMPAKKLERCPPEKSYCFLSLEEVIFTDGSKWERRYEPDDPNRKD
jgi:hypothetical protein